MKSISKLRVLLALLFTVTMLVGTSCRHGSDAPTPEPTPNPNDGAELKLPAKEIRAVWMATIWELDWPLGKRGEAEQKQLYIDYLETLHALNFNAIFLQIRSGADAFYKSKYEPWSKWLTGTRGKDPGWDVLGFMLDEAHRRGIAVHAWINPFRVSSGNVFPEPAPYCDRKLITKQGKMYIYNPALPEARQWIADIVKEIITKYDFDGVHVDDYFYPDAKSPAVQAELDDAADFAKYGAGYKDVKEFRRANVDKAIQGIYQTVHKYRPEIPFSVSPAADYMYSYLRLYADIYKWCKEGWVDAVIPQLYQEIGNKYNDHRGNINQWAQHAYKASVIIGNGLYRFGDPKSPSAFQSTQELKNQFRLSRADRRVVGNAQFSVKYLMMNKLDIRDTFKELYPTPAVRPVLGQVIGSAPSAPTNVIITKGELSWQGDGAYYAVYHQPEGSNQLKVVTITAKKKQSVGTNKGTYYVTAITRNDFESSLSKGVKL